jgi:2-phosphosulfolactate phosphatase
VERTVVIGHGPPHSVPLGANDAVVVVDVIRSMTTAITGRVLGRRCLPVPSVEQAFARARALAVHDPLLVGESGGTRPDGFDLTNSPAEIARRFDIERPMVLLSSSGTPLLDDVTTAGAIYLGCLRNWRATARVAIERHARVAILCAATRGEQREEDELCAAFIAEALVHVGFRAEDVPTQTAIHRWSGSPPDAFLCSKSVRYLRATNQLDDLDFILTHIDDVRAPFALRRGEVVEV